MSAQLLRSGAALFLVVGLTGCNAGSTLDSVGSSIAGGFETITSGSLFSDDYLADRSDACFSQRQAMAEHGSFFDEGLVVATVGGAATGAVAGGLIAALRGDEVWKGALIGGAVGAATGYLGKKLADGADPDSIIGQAFGDIEKENRQIDELLRSFRGLKDCRVAEARAVQGAYNAKQLDKASAQDQMAAVRSKYDADVAKFREIADQIAENTESYAAIYNEVAADNNAQSLEVKEPAKVRTGRKSARLSKKKPRKTAGTPKGSLKAKKKQNVKKLQDECLTNVRKRDECIEEIQAAKEKESEMELDLG
ncbi:MAG: hypothetical protein AAFV19_11770 [Pseudomonadota bacterium]